MKTKKGSAMVITLLLLATVGSISFAVGRLFILDIAVSQMYDDSVIAYYAAESGIEEGLLRYRFNKNSEIEPGIVSKPNDHSFTDRSNLENLTLEAHKRTTAEDTSANLTDRTYDLRMYYKTSDLCNSYREDYDGKCKTIDDYDFIRLPANESMKLDISNLKNKGYDLKIKSDESNKREIAVEAKIVTNKSPQTIEPVEYKKLLISQGLENDLATNKANSYYFVETKGNFYQVSDFVEKIVGAVSINFSNDEDPDKSAELYLKPVALNKESGGIKFMITRNQKGVSDNASLASLYTTVKSVGHYGDVTRTLKAEIDRQSGTLYDVFDFVIYKY